VARLASRLALMRLGCRRLRRFAVMGLVVSYLSPNTFGDDS
jgi:hypothetical protein